MLAKPAIVAPKSSNHSTLLDSISVTMLRLLHTLSNSSRQRKTLLISLKLHPTGLRLWKASVISISCQIQSPNLHKEHPLVTLWQLKDSILLKAIESVQSIWTWFRWIVLQWARNRVIIRKTTQLWAVATRKTSMLVQLLKAQLYHRLHLAEAVDVSEQNLILFLA